MTATAYPLLLLAHLERVDPADAPDAWTHAFSGLASGAPRLDAGEHTTDLWELLGSDELRRWAHDHAMTWHSIKGTLIEAAWQADTQHGYVADGHALLDAVTSRLREGLDDNAQAQASATALSLIESSELGLTFQHAVDGVGAQHGEAFAACSERWPLYVAIVRQSLRELTAAPQPS